MNWSLARLALVRALPVGWIALAGVLAALVVQAAWQPEASTQTALAGDAHSAALARAGTWTALLALNVPWLVARAASAPGRWRAGEIEWLARATLPRLAVVASIWIGLALAALLAVAAIGGVAELAAARRADVPAQELTARFATPGSVLAPGAAPVRVIFDPGSAGERARARVHLVYLGGGAVAEVRATCAPTDATERPAPTEVIVSSGRVIELPLDPAGGLHELVLEHTGGQAALQLAGDGIEVARPLGVPSLASLRFGLRVWVALTALLALALGLGAWMGATTACAACAAVSLAALLAEGTATRWLPSAGLTNAHALLGEGLAGPWPAARVWIGAALGALAGLLLAARGLARWRSAAR